MVIKRNCTLFFSFLFFLLFHSELFFCYNGKNNSFVSCDAVKFETESPANDSSNLQTDCESTAGEDTFSADSTSLETINNGLNYSKISSYFLMFDSLLLCTILPLSFYLNRGNGACGSKNCCETCCGNSKVDVPTSLQTDHEDVSIFLSFQKCICAVFGNFSHIFSVFKDFFLYKYLIYCTFGIGYYILLGYKNSSNIIDILKNMIFFIKYTFRNIKNTMCQILYKDFLEILDDVDFDKLH